MKTLQPAQSGYLPRLVRDLLPDDQRHRVHPICRLPKGFRLLQPWEKIIPGCRFTRPGKPSWVDCMVGETHHSYDPKAYFVHCIPNSVERLQRELDKLKADIVELNQRLHERTQALLAKEARPSLTPAEIEHQQFEAWYSKASLDERCDAALHGWKAVLAKSTTPSS